MFEELPARPNPINLLIKSNPTRHMPFEEEKDWLRETLMAYQAFYDTSPSEEDISFARHIVELADSLSTDRLIQLNSTPAGREVLHALRDGSTVEATVVSADIRNSTTLMEASKDQKVYAHFLSSLLSNIHHFVMEDYGVFEKFTGDGALAFFPKVLAGRDHSLRAIRCASRIHEVFRSLYDAAEANFEPPIVTGLGIGIAAGEIEIVRIRRRLSIVGSSVVNACRLGSAPHGQTFCYPAFKNQASSLDRHCAKFYRESLNVKPQPVVAYRIDYLEVTPEAPAWQQEH